MLKISKLTSCMRTILSGYDIVLGSLLAKPMVVQSLKIINIPLSFCYSFNYSNYNIFIVKTPVAIPNSLKNGFLTFVTLKFPLSIDYC